VIYAEERSRRPTDYAPPASSNERRLEDCPFCEGNESETPPELFALRDKGSRPDGPGWSLRVFPNKFSALRPEGELNPTRRGLYRQMNGIGRHELILESPAHSAHLGEYSLGKLATILRVYRDRIASIYEDSRIRYVQIFRNWGAQAGASLEHPHTQLIALPNVPRLIEDELTRSREYFEKTGRCLLCDVLDQEKREGERVLFENEDFLTFAPFFGWAPFETWILPKRHDHDFSRLSEYDLKALAEAVRPGSWAIEQALGRPPFNLNLHTAPKTADDRETPAPVDRFYHWRIELAPRITVLAGLEWATGDHINTKLPERAAATMRDLLARTPVSPQTYDR
jgi:UDPglucose--hexose-1-phosphate uridylyltransferase